MSLKIKKFENVYNLSIKIGWACLKNHADYNMCVYIRKPNIKIPPIKSIKSILIDCLIMILHNNCLLSVKHNISELKCYNIIYTSDMKTINIMFRC